MGKAGTQHLRAFGLKCIDALALLLKAGSPFRAGVLHLCVLSLELLSTTDEVEAVAIKLVLIIVLCILKSIAEKEKKM